MATFEPTAHEQYLLELINRARQNPLDEVARNSSVSDLNQGLAPGTLDATARQPLAFNFELTAAARDHSQWMLDTDTFSHTGKGGSSAGDRMADAGYQFTGAYTWGENLSWRGTTGTLDLEKSLGLQHDGLFESPGHRTNLMNGDFQEIGLGALTGNFQGYNAAMVTQNFAKAGEAAYLTGVVYDDEVEDDDFYDIGEGVSGVSIQAVRESDGKTFATQNYDSGGYSLALEPGTYQVTFSGDEIGNPVTEKVNISQKNIKLDLLTDLLVTTSQANLLASETVAAPSQVSADPLGVAASTPETIGPEAELPFWLSSLLDEGNSLFAENFAAWSS